MQNKFDHESYKASVEKYNLAKELRKADKIAAAIPTINEAGRLFAKIHNVLRIHVLATQNMNP